jgi:hypothetical protein
VRFRLTATGFACGGCCISMNDSDLDCSRLRQVDLDCTRRPGAASRRAYTPVVRREFHNPCFFHAGLCVVGAPGYMAWLNERGIGAVAVSTQDIGSAARQDLKVAAPASFAEVLARTRMPHHPVPSLAPSGPSSSLKLPGAAGLRVDLMTSGAETGPLTSTPGLHAQPVEHCDYLLEDDARSRPAGRWPLCPGQAAVRGALRLYSAAVRKTFPEKAAKDLRQAATLAAAITAQDDEALAHAAGALAAAMRRAVVSHRKAILGALGGPSASHAALEHALHRLSGSAAHAAASHPRRERVGGPVIAGRCRALASFSWPARAP